MAITSSVGDGIRVTTAAKDSRLLASVLGAQGSINANQVVVPNAIGTNNQGQLETSPTYVDRLIMIRPDSERAATVAVQAGGSSYVQNDTITVSGGTNQNPVTCNVDAVDGGGAVTQISINTPVDQASPDGPGSYTVTPSNPASTTGGTGSGLTVNLTWEDCQEVRYITADASNTLTVHEDWDQIPVRNEDWAIPYNPADVDLSGVSGCTQNAKTGVYEFSRRFSVGTSGGGTWAWFFVTKFQGLEADDNGTSDWGFQCEADGRWQCGYLAGGKPISGGILSSVNNVAGEWFLSVKSGAILRWYQTIVRSQIVDVISEYLGGDDIVMESVLSIDSAYTADLKGGSYKDVTWQGVGTTNDDLELDSGSLIEGMLMASTYGFDSVDDGVTEAITVRGCTFVGTNTRFVYIHDDKTWDFVDAVFDLAISSSTIVFETDDLNACNLKFSLSLVVAELDGTPIEEAQCYVYEGTTNQDLPSANQVDTDSAGEATSDVLYRNITYPSSVWTSESYGGFALKVFKWLYSPFVASVTNPGDDQGLDLAIPLLDDNAIVETTQATAITNGSGVDWTKESNPCTLLSYDTGTVLMSASDVVSGNTSGAQGTVVELAEGDITSGRVFLQTRNGTAFQAGEDLYVSGGKVAQAANPLVALDFAWHFECNSKTLQACYDYQAARMAEDSPTTDATNMMKWGEAEHAYMLQPDGADWKTVRNVNLTEGVYLSDRGSGTVSEMVADDGTTYTPPVSYTYTVGTTDQPLDSGSDVSIMKKSDLSDLNHTDSSGTTFGYTYQTAMVSTEIVVQVIPPPATGGLIQRWEATLTAADVSVPFFTSEDRAYAND